MLLVMDETEWNAFCKSHQSCIQQDWRCLDPVGPRPARVEFFEFEVKPELFI